MASGLRAPFTCTKELLQQNAVSPRIPLGERLGYQRIAVDDRLSRDRAPNAMRKDYAMPSASNAVVHEFLMPALKEQAPRFGIDPVLITDDTVFGRNARRWLSIQGAACAL